MTVKIAWAITGAGDYLLDTLNVMRELKQELDVSVTVLLSENGEFVVKWYRLWDQLNADFGEVSAERGANVPFVAGPLQLGHYAFLYISPATSNTVAKIAYGIADSLVTNCVAQTIKGGTPVYIYPVDQVLGSQDTQGPKGQRISISTRPVDIENVERLRAMPGIEVLGHPGEITPITRATLDLEGQ